MRRRKRKSKRNPSGFWAWAKEHWFLTFLLAGGVLNIAALVVLRSMAPKLEARPSTPYPLGENSF